MVINSEAPNNLLYFNFYQWMLQENGTSLLPQGKQFISVEAS